MKEPVIIAGPAEFQNRFHVSRETIDRLKIYAEELKRWQKAVNLVAPGTLGEIWHRHFADSAQLAELVPLDAARHADLGSGGGFPGLVLAIMMAERVTPPVTRLVESDQRKCAFLRGNSPAHRYRCGDRDRAHRKSRDSRYSRHRRCCVCACACTSRTPVRTFRATVWR